MRHALSILYSSAVALMMVGIFAVTSYAQNAAGSAGTEAPPLGSVTNGDRTIVFEPATLNDSDETLHKTWAEFADAHPDIVQQLGGDPHRLRDSDYLKKYPELDKFLTAHPDLRQSMLANPGNYVVPRK
jgi:hypothetical protein